jgi:hypothetical protein
MTRLTGVDAIRRAERDGRTLSKYNDPIEEAREDLSVEEANAVARDDPGLIYLDVEDDALGGTAELKSGAPATLDPTGALREQRLLGERPEVVATHKQVLDPACERVMDAMLVLAAEANRLAAAASAGHWGRLVGQGTGPLERAFCDAQRALGALEEHQKEIVRLREQARLEGLDR